MRLAYGCAGEGFGHVSRMAVLLPHLEAHHEVGLFLPPSVKGFLEAKVGPRGSVPIPGIHYVQKGDRIRWAASIRAMLPVLLGFPFEVVRLARRLRAKGYQAVLSDYEPHMAWAGRLAGLPVFQLNHPGVLTRVVGSDVGTWLAAWGSRVLEGPWDRRVLVSFFQGDVGPLLRPGLLRRRPRTGSTLVVNLKDSYRAQAEAVLARFTGLDYRVFPNPGANFDEALLDCAAVVTPAGHQVLAEALALGKPVLALPQAGQPEQQLNAEQLVATGRGRIGSLETLEHDLQAFLDQLPELRSATPEPHRFNLEDGTPDLLASIDEFLATRLGT